MSKREYEYHTEKSLYDDFQQNKTSCDDVLDYAIKDVCDGLKQPFSFLQTCKMCNQLGKDLSRICVCADSGLLCVRARKLIRWLHHKKGCHSRQFLDIIVHDPIVDITSNILDDESSFIIGSFYESSLQNAEMQFCEKETENFGFNSDWDIDPFLCSTSLCVDTLFRHEPDEEIQIFQCHTVSDLSLAISSALFHVEFKCYRHMWRLPAPPCLHIDPKLYSLVKKYYFLCINLKIGLISYTEAERLLVKCMVRIFDEAGFPKSSSHALDSLLAIADYQRSLPNEYSCTKSDAELTEFFNKLKS